MKTFRGADGEPVRLGDGLEGIQATIARIRAKQQQSKRRLSFDPLARCKTCFDTGFEELRGLADGLSIGTVRRCPAGCMPPKPKTFTEAIPRPRPVPNDSEVF